MATTEYDHLYIGGEWVKPSGTDTIVVNSPFTEEPIGRVPSPVKADVDRAVEAARTAFDSGPWPRMKHTERAEIVRKVALAIANETQSWAELISSEMGAPLGWGMLGQALAPTMVLNYYADLATSFKFDEVRQGLLSQVLVTREPVGVVAAITPWNVPLLLSCGKLAPALIAGCTIVFKPAPETPLNANRLAETLEEAGLPKGVLSVIPADREVAEYLVRHPKVDKVSFTGSGLAGRKIASICGEQLKRCSLELGGKSAAILLDDVNLDAALPSLIPNAIMNNGEACIAQTRILAPRDRYDEVVDALVERVGALKVGDPLDMSTEVGPLVAERQRDRVEGYIKAGESEGAKVAVGGGRPSSFSKGWFVEPTVFINVDNSMKIAQEEIFGPVLAVIPYDGDESAISIANDSSYGLCGSVWTSDPDRGLKVARGVRTGTYMLNSSIPFDFATPFGGFKESGIGREYGPEGLELFTEIKSINLQPGYTPNLEG
jgi:betaine-aldehyde dehydrogenase